MTAWGPDEGVTLFIGQTKSGKTTALRRELHRLRARAVVFDMRRSRALDGLASCETREGFRRALLGKPWPAGHVLVVRFPRVDDYAWAAGSVYAWRSLVWVLDDARGQLDVPGIFTHAAEAARAGRHFGAGAGVELWLACHRPYDVHPDLRAQVLRIRSFRQREPRDLALLATWASSTFAERVARLTGHEMVSWPEDNDGG